MYLCTGSAGKPADATQTIQQPKPAVARNNDCVLGKIIHHDRPTDGRRVSQSRRLRNKKLFGQKRLRRQSEPGTDVYIMAIHLRT